MNANDENITFAFTSYNSPPNTPAALAQYKTDASTTIANQAWTNEQSVHFSASAIDPDTDEVVKMYLELLANADDFATSTAEPFGACDSAVDFDSCTSKTWVIASSSGDFSVTPLTASATISGLPESSIGYKWQVIACDDEIECSAWKIFDVTAPNFYVDITPPDMSGCNLTITDVTSQSVKLVFGADADEDNFDKYRIFYSTSSPVTESDTEHVDSDLNYQDYHSTADTPVTGLASSTGYVFNIWAYDLAGNKASAAPEAATTTLVGPNLAQTSYLFENDSGTTVNNNSAATGTDSALTDVYVGERINVRIQLENNGGDTAGNKVYRLEYENQTDAPGSWIPVGAATQISYSGGLSGNNGDPITSSKCAFNANTRVDGEWHKNTGQTGSFELGSSKFTEFVFVIQTANAGAGKTYRLRLYDVTGSAVLNSYSSYPSMTIISPETLNYSKGTYASLPSLNGSLSYYLDPKGYNNTSVYDAAWDTITSSSQIPITMFTVKHTNNTDALDVTWNGQSSTSTALKNVVLQVYEFGSPNQWVTMDTESAAVADTDFNLTASLNSTLSLYYDGSYRTYWRVYQQSGSQVLRTDRFNIDFSVPVPGVGQIHYRWRNDNGNESAATWRESQDVGDPTDPTTPIEKLENIRIRIETANIGGGEATGYKYGLQYATSTGSCTSGIGNWTAIPTDNSLHWQMASSTYFIDGASTAARFSNSEGYTFVAGRMTEDPSTTTQAITLGENHYTEIEYVIRATNHAADAGTYCFRVTNSGVALDNYTKYPILTLAGNVNTAPYFTVDPADSDSSGASASTSPTNEGEDVTFKATADDDDSPNYYLAICKTNSITAGNDGPPTCTAGNWCISDLTATATEASCSYTAAAVAESNVWYAFVCDKHSGFSIAKCSAASQGSGDPEYDSPFVINHRPVFTSVTTSVNNRNPGGTFTISSVSHDNDSSGGADTLYLYICRTNSAAYGSGCDSAENTVCTALATSSPNAKCYYRDTAPTPAGANTYYAFLYDSHGLAAAANSRSNTYTVNNVVPTMGTLTLHGGADITLNIRGAGDTAVSTVNTNIQDMNGCDDLDSAVGTVYMSNATGGYNCTANNNDCYKAATANCVKSDCASSTDTIATFTCTVGMKYYADPTDDFSANNPWKNYNWMSYLQVYDGVNYALATSTGVELITSAALEVVENEIDFGSGFSVGDDTGNNDATTTILNGGNSPIDTNLSGTDMNGNPSGMIDSTYIQYSLNNFTYPAGVQLLNTGVDVDIDAPKATGADVEDKIYWGIGIPWDADASLYTGLNTFQVIIDEDSW